jgi:hypothetical protein
MGDLTRLLTESIILSMLSNALMTASSMLVGEAVGLDLSIYDYQLLSGVIQIGMLIPAGVAGLGAKDLSVVAFLSLVPTTKALSVTYAISLYPLTLAFAFAGALATLMQKDRQN